MQYFEPTNSVNITLYVLICYHVDRCFAYDGAGVICRTGPRDTRLELRGGDERSGLVYVMSTYSHTC